VITDTDRLHRMRTSYQRAGLSEGDLAATWTLQFTQWLDDAVACGLPEPNAMIVATVGAGAAPSARTVLLKGVHDDGFVFYTNYGSRKGTEIAANPAVSLVFPWFPIGRQVVVTGTAAKVERPLTERYFASRPRDSQLGAWASAQSTVVASREVLDQAWIDAEQRFPDAVPAPPHWGGILVAPDSVEFWQGRVGRLHDRLRFRESGAGWIVERLAP
jgi:pyridoxamine 5'-phosphate oxidase